MRPLAVLLVLTGGLAVVVVASISLRQGERADAPAIVVDGRHGRFEASPALGMRDPGASTRQCSRWRSRLRAAIGHLISASAQLRTFAATLPVLVSALDRFDRRWRVRMIGLKPDLFALRTCASFDRARALAMLAWRDLLIQQKTIVADARSGTGHGPPRGVLRVDMELRDLVGSL
jgi:hypothetical protein